MIGSNTAPPPRNGLSVIEPMKMLDLRGGIFHWQIINYLIKSKRTPMFDLMRELITCQWKIPPLMSNIFIGSITDNPFLGGKTVLLPIVFNSIL